MIPGDTEETVDETVDEKDKDKEGWGCRSDKHNDFWRISGALIKLAHYCLIVSGNTPVYSHVKHRDSHHKSAVDIGHCAFCFNCGIRSPLFASRSR